MGAGASSANNGSSAVSAKKTAVAMNKKAKAKNDGDFNIVCRVVFDEADRNKNGKLDNGEVRHLFFLRLLNNFLSVVLYRWPRARTSLPTSTANFGNIIVTLQCWYSHVVFILQH